MTTLLHLKKVQIRGTDGEKQGPGQYAEWHEAKSLTVYPQQFTCSTDKYATTSTTSTLLTIVTPSVVTGGSKHYGTDPLSEHRRSNLSLRLVILIKVSSLLLRI